MKKLTKKWQLVLYGFAGMGVNMLNLIVGSYLCDALMIEGFDKNVENWTYLNKTLIIAGIWSLMITIAKIVDGVVDIPLASFTDNLKTKWGKRRPAILIGFIPMVISFIAFLFPISKEAGMANTIWFGLLLCLFYSFYTLTMVTYYATFSEIVDNNKDRIFLSNIKTIFDVIYFVLGYALIPVFVGMMNIRTIALMFLPLSLTMLIPLFLIKEKSTLTKDVEARIAAGEVEDDGSLEEKEETVNIWKSFVYTLKNKSFVIWMIVYCALQFGLQLFLTGQNVYYSGTMKVEGFYITLMMACVFGPVPFFLILYNKIIKTKGIKVGYIFSVSAFVVSMILLCIAQEKLIPSLVVRLVLGCVGSVFASIGIGCFFSINYTIPSAIAAVEKKQTGISHPAMYFAVQGLFSGVATAISTGIVWVNIKNAGANNEFVWLMPVVVIVASVLSIVLTILLPKEINEIGLEKNN